VRQKWVIWAISSILTVISALPVIAADSNGAKYVWPLPPAIQGDPMNLPLMGYHFGIMDDFTQGGNAESASFLSVSGSIQPLCSGFNDPVCQRELSKGKNGWWANAVLPPCSTVGADAYCVEGVVIKDSNGQRDLKLKQVLTGPTWQADSNHGSIPGGTPSLWVDPNESDSTLGYKITAGGNLSVAGVATSPTDTFLTSFQSSIAAYKEVQGNYNGYMPSTNSDGVTHVGFGRGLECIWSEKGVCGIQTDFKPGARLQLKVHLPFGLASWLIGRISDPDISIVSIPGQPRIQSVSVEASPVLIPLFAVDVPIEKTSQAFQNEYNHAGFCTVFPLCSHGFVGGNTAASYPLAFQGFDLFHDYWDQKAQMLMPTWSVRTSINRNVSGLSNCSQGLPMFSGLVTTNASIYEGNPPTWDGASLNYKVAGLHLDPDGNIFQGSYDLIMNSQYARCLYKFSNAPITATVSITDSQGTNEVATTSFQEKNGWVHLAARGFTFSSPTVKVALQQVVPTPSVSPTPNAMATPTSSVPATTAKKQTTIMCTKGKSTKSVTGSNPKCPIGFKKK